MASDILSICSRPYAELVAASYSRNDVPNNHLSSGNTIPEASSAKNVVRNNRLPLGGTAPVASSAQNGVLNGHLSSGNNVTDNVVCCINLTTIIDVSILPSPLNKIFISLLQQPQQKTLNVDGYNVSWNGSGTYGAHSGYGNYQQPTLLRPQYVPPPNLPQTVQRMSSSTRSGKNTVNAYSMVLLFLSQLFID
jgi:hypothetical protein